MESSGSLVKNKLKTGCIFQECWEHWPYLEVLFLLRLRACGRTEWCKTMMKMRVAVKQFMELYSGYSA